MTHLFGQKKQKVIQTINDLTPSDVCLITRSYHDSWIDWSNDDKYIVYISPAAGNNNLYRIPLDSIHLVETQNNFFVANYLLDPTIDIPMQQITFERDRYIDSPIFLPETNAVAYQTHFKYSPNGFFDYDIRVYDFKIEKTKIIYKGELLFFDFIDSDTMLFVNKIDKNTLQKLTISTGEITSFVTLAHTIEGLQFDSDHLLIKSSNGIYTLDLKTQQFKLIYDRKIFATRMLLNDNQLFATFPGPASGMVDIKSKNYITFFNATDYEPSLSNNKKFVAAISERSLGILIKRVESPTITE